MSEGAPRDGDERETAQAIERLAWRAICASRYALRPREWDRICVVVEAPADPVVELRVCVAERLRGAGLEELAHDVVTRQVSPGYVMLFASFDDETQSGVGVELVQLVDRPASGRRRR